MKKIIWLECENIFDVAVPESRIGRIFLKLGMNKGQFKKLKKVVTDHEREKKTIAMRNYRAAISN